MGRRTRRNIEAREKRGGEPFVGIPHIVLRSQSFAYLSRPATKLLLDLLAQYNGYNNGDLCATFSVMRKRGWKSESTLYAARRELENKEWIQVTRQGGRNTCTLYAVTFFGIDECNGKLDVIPRNKPSQAWRRHEPTNPLRNSVTPKSVVTGR